MRPRSDLGSRVTYSPAHPHKAQSVRGLTSTVTGSVGSPIG
jgi:hypothetical protein